MFREQLGSSCGFVWTRAREYAADDKRVHGNRLVSFVGIQNLVFALLTVYHERGLIVKSSEKNQRV